MDGWVDDWVSEELDGWVRWIEARVDVWVSGWKGKWMDE